MCNYVIFISRMRGHNRRFDPCNYVYIQIMLSNMILISCSIWAYLYWAWLLWSMVGKLIHYYQVHIDIKNMQLYTSIDVSRCYNLYNSVFCKLLPQNFLRKCTNIHQTQETFFRSYSYILVHLTSFHNTLNLKRITPQKTSLFKIFNFCVLAGHWIDPGSKRAAKSCRRLLLDHPSSTAH